MKQKTLNVAALIMLLTATQAAQIARPKTYVVNSWKQGNGKVQERELTFDVITLSKKPIRETIKDSSGQDKYALTAKPIEKTDSSAAGFQAWFIDLTELSTPQSPNLLKPSIDLRQDSFRPEDRISVLLYQSFDASLGIILAPAYIDQRFNPLSSRSCASQKNESHYCHGH